MLSDVISVEYVELSNAIELAGLFASFVVAHFKS